MGRYTEEENRRINAMRRQRQADQQRADEHWSALGVGYKDTDTEYRVYYQDTNDRCGWISASPFYEPLSDHPDWTHDSQRAEEIADLIMAGQWAVEKQSEPGKVSITAVRVVETITTGKIIHQRHA